MKTTKKSGAIKAFVPLPPNNGVMLPFVKEVSGANQIVWILLSAIGDLIVTGAPRRKCQWERPVPTLVPD